MRHTIAKGERVAREKRSDDVLDKLGLDIAAGLYPVGTTIPTEAVLAETHGVGRSSIREAIGSLVRLGMVEAMPRRGTVVTERSSWQTLSPEVLHWVMASDGHSSDLLTAIIEARRVFEPAAAALVARRATRLQIVEIERAYAQMEVAAEHLLVPEVVEADRAFHLAILKATGNPILESFNVAINEILGVLFGVTANHMANFKANLPNHLGILEAIRRRDPDAAEAAMLATIDFTTGKMKDNGLIG